MKVDLRIYLAKNLGDDLFLEIISDRYKNTKFLVCPTLKYNNDEINSNVVMRNNWIERKYNYICNKLRLYFFNTNKLISKKCDLSLIVGGSIFQEGAKWHLFKKKLDLFSNLNKNYYILSCNFGPYNSELFFDMHKQVISEAQDVCFRDKKSYNLFNDLNNVRYCSDIVFSLNCKKYLREEENKVVISVIDLQWRNKLSDYLNVYEDKIIEMIKFFSDKKLKVVLMSFSRHEGDMNAILRIMSSIDDQYKNNIEIHDYNGDIKKALFEISSSKIVVSSRFHANILGLLFNKTIIPIIYSNKTENLLNDINFKGKKTTIEDIRDFSIDFSKEDLQYKVDISKQVESAKKQFEKLDLILKDKQYE